jgi:hypothetical protein
MPVSKKYSVILFFIAWFLLNLLQAGSTGLFDYFDHPPMIAVFIKAGYFLFHNEFGVRLFIVTCSTLTLAIIYRLLPRKNDTLFYAIACSMAILQIGGIIAVPDLPLTFFVALFFLFYKRFCEKMSIPNTLLLAIIMALMLYTKYHAILIIFFTFLSNPKLALQYRAYIAAVIATALFSPHLYWQYQHAFPSAYYQLFERNANTYEIRFTLEYIIGQVLIAGPFMGWLILLAAFKYKPHDLFEKALQYSLVGIYVLFLISSLKGRVEANWTVPAFIPVIILSHQYLVGNIKWQRILIKSIPLTLVFVLALRIYMMLDIGPLKFVSKDEFHRSRDWADSIKKKTNGLPVVFINSYQFASKYWFYSGITAFSLNTPSGRRNNYNFWPIEDSLINRRIVALSPYDYTYYPDSIITPLGTTGMRVVDSFYSFSKLIISSPHTLLAKNGAIKKCRLEFTVPKNYLEVFKLSKLHAASVNLVIIDGNNTITQYSTNIMLSDIKKTEQSIVTNFNINLPRGSYTARYALPTSLSIDPSLNSTTVNLIVD